MFHDNLQFLFSAVFPEFRIIHKGGQHFASPRAEEFLRFLAVGLADLFEEELRIVENEAAPDGLFAVFEPHLQDVRVPAEDHGTRDVDVSEREERLRIALAAGFQKIQFPRGTRIPVCEPDLAVEPDDRHEVFLGKSGPEIDLSAENLEVFLPDLQTSGFLMSARLLDERPERADRADQIIGVNGTAGAFQKALFRLREHDHRAAVFLLQTARDETDDGLMRGVQTENQHRIFEKAGLH